MQKVKNKKTNPRFAGRYDLDLIIWSPRTTYIEHPQSCSPAHSSCSIHKTRQEINKVWRKKKKEAKRKYLPNWKDNMMFMALLSSWDSEVLIFPNLWRRKAEVASSKSCCPKRRNDTYTIPFPNLFLLKLPKRSLQSAFSTLSNGSWHFSGKQYHHSTLEMYISFSSHEVCACQQGKIPTHTPDSHQRERWCWRQRDTRDRSCYQQIRWER